MDLMQEKREKNVARGMDKTYTVTVRCLVDYSCSDKSRDAEHFY